MAFHVGDLVNADGLDRPDLPMLSPHPTDVLTAWQTFSQLCESSAPSPSGQFARPVGKVEHVGPAQRVFAHAPRHFLHLHPEALHSTRLMLYSNSTAKPHTG